MLPIQTIPSARRNSATVTIHDNEPTVTITATDNSASEPSTDKGVYTFTRSVTGAALVVNYAMTGTATNGTDYTNLNGTVTIPSGSSTVTLTLSPIDDTLAEGDETAILTISTNANYGAGSPSSDTVTIHDDEPTVTVTATDNSASEPGADKGVYTFTRTNAGAALVVNYGMTGTATNNTDYSTLNGTVTIPSGSSTVTLTITPKDDAVAEGDETAILTIGNSANYFIGSSNADTVTIHDDEPTLTVSATDPNAAEQGQDPGVFTITRSNTGDALAVNYSMSGTATNNSDYSSLSGTVTIPSGSSSVNVTLTPIDDATAEGSETAILTLSSGSYFVGTPNNATVTIADNESTVTVQASTPNASELGPISGVFTISRLTTSGNLVVNYTIGGTATSGSDFTALAGSATILNGQSSVTVTVVPIDDSASEGNETVLMTLASGSYTIGTPNNATVTIADNDTSSSNSVTFLSTDTTHQGSWKGVYGSDGYNIVGSSSSYPPGVTVTPSGNSTYTWYSTTADVRGLQKPDPATDRVAATWYNNTSFTVTIALGPNPRQVALYMLDFDALGRAQTVDVLDGATNAVLDSRSISSLSNGKYLVYQGSGTLIFRFTNNVSGLNAILNGIFLGQSTGGITYLATDTTHQGSWQGAYGSDGYSIVGSSSSLPTGVTITPSGNFTYTWSSTTSDVRGLQKPSPATDRIAATWYNGSYFNVTIALGSTPRKVAFYMVDWDNLGRAQTVDVLDAQTNAVLDSRSVSSFSNGKYLVYQGSGTLTFRFTNNVPGLNAVLSGIFFGQAGNQVTYLSTDTTHQGSWKSIYGSSGYNIVGSSSSYPAGISVNPAGNSTYTWYSSTSDVRGLQKPDPATDRVAAAWYNNTSFSVTVALGSSKWRVALYMIDFDGLGRAQTVDVLDGTTNAVLDTRSISSFSNGKYLVYEGTGTMIFRFTNTAGAYNAVLSGIFFDNSFAQDGFETGGVSGGIGWGGNWSLTGNASIVSTGSPQSGVYHLQLASNDGMASRAVSLAGVTSATLAFDWKANSFESGETAVVEIYNGTSWINVMTISDGQDDNVYHHASIDLSGYALTSGFQVRFRSLMSAADDYLYIDNLVIST